jgi:hypothetical protein
MGILTSLIVLQMAEQLDPITSGKATMICDSQSALRNAFKTGPIGVKSTTQDEYDILLEILNLRRTLRTYVTPAWIESTKTMMHLTVEQQINADAHKQAMKRLQDDDQTNMIDLTAILENQTVSVFSNGNIITTSLPQQIITNMHYEPLKDKLKKDNECSDTIFNMVDWHNFHSAIHNYPRAHRISLSKLSHGLWNINAQNHKYYGVPNTCPLCKIAAETLDHVFHCSALTAQEHRETELSQYKAKFQKIKTPPEIKSLILAGITQSPCKSHRHPPAYREAQQPLELKETQTQQAEILVGVSSYKVI